MPLRFRARLASQTARSFIRNDPAFQKVVTEWMASEAYRKLRASSKPELSSANGNENKLPSSIRLVQPLPGDRYVTCVPLVSLKIAAGVFSDPQNVDERDFEWAEVRTKRKLRRGMFIAKVIGESMEPLIPDGSYCLFSAPVTGSRQGKIILVQLRDEVDPETGELIQSSAIFG